MANTTTSTTSTSFPFTSRQVAGFISSTITGINNLINYGGDAFSNRGPQPTLKRAIDAWEAGDLRTALNLARVAGRLVEIRMAALPE